MDEMNVLKTYRDAVPPSTSADLEPARRRLFTEMSQRSGQPGRWSIRFTRPAMWVTGAVAAAGVLAVALVVPGQFGPDSGPVGQVAAPSPSSAGSDAEPGAPASGENPEATRILARAAAAVLGDPFAVPRADQFLYSKDGTWEGWLSVDGQHDGLVIVDGDRVPVPGCRNGKKDIYKGDVKLGQEDCQPTPAYLPDLPTTGQAMYEYVRETSLPTDNSFTNRAAKNIMELSRLYISPSARAALLEAAGRFSGITVVPDAEVNGRHGIGVGWQYGGVDSLLLFDPQTYVPIGPEFALVDAIDQRP